MPSPIFLSRPSAGFTFVSVFRGAQLTVLGTYRALRNPELIKHGYYRKAAIAVGISIVVQLILWLPLVVLRWALEFSAYISGSSNHHTESVIDTLRFLQNNVFNVGPLLISGVRFFKPEMDDLFLISLKFVDRVYKSKHPDTDRQYYPALIESGRHYQRVDGIGGSRVSSWVEHVVPGWVVQNTTINGHTAPSLPPRPTSSASNTPPSTPPPDQPPAQSIATNNNNNNSNINSRRNNGSRGSKRAFFDFLANYVQRSGTTLLALLFSHVPIIGPLVLPVLSFMSFNSVAGTPAAVVVFAIGFMVPRRMMIVFLSSFWGSRSLVHELLIPYFSRLSFSKPQKTLWFSNRQGIMFGFGAGFYLFMKIPFIGVLVYGLAEASAAYLITKVSDPPPLQIVKISQWTEHQTHWTADDKVISERIDSDDGFSSANFSASIPGGPGGWTS
ncbi:hypothetical protein AWJ20_5252 [Sugiyamaella lignohabitans]|uniref:Uncharacterized protein n=1 Tax=Sugiyamaella lignohabitans TaxID=796027 RepID=A0A161HLL4_9ASCO|nr:uncharacterized protein AWJ20_5252 [Sugiyamaella lignohabitans]ANB14287.1 hypothetical protein AWJ20_5252 [Sugiyamaella lignohabitans]